MQSLGKKNSHDIGMEDRRIIGPPEHLHDVGTERPAELHRIAARHNEFREIDDDRDLLRRLFTAANGLKVESPKEIAIDQLKSRPGFACLHGRAFIPKYLLQPVGPVFSSLDRTNTS